MDVNLSDYERTNLKRDLKKAAADVFACVDGMADARKSAEARLQELRAVQLMLETTLADVQQDAAKKVPFSSVCAEAGEKLQDFQEKLDAGLTGLSEDFRKMAELKERAAAAEHDLAQALVTLSDALGGAEPRPAVEAAPKERSESMRKSLLAGISAASAHLFGARKKAEEAPAETADASAADAVSAVLPAHEATDEERAAASEEFAALWNAVLEDDVVELREVEQIKAWLSRNALGATEFAEMDAWCDSILAKGVAEPVDVDSLYDCSLRLLKALGAKLDA